MNETPGEALRLLEDLKPTVRSTGERDFYVDYGKDSVSMKKLIWMPDRYASIAGSQIGESNFLSEEALFRPATL